MVLGMLERMEGRMEGGMLGGTLDPACARCVCQEWLSQLAGTVSPVSPLPQ